MSYREMMKPDAALYLREQAIARFPLWDIAESIPDGERIMLLERPLVLIYSQDSFREPNGWTWSEVFGYRVFAGSRESPDAAREVAREVEAWLWAAARYDRASPVAAVTDSNGPNLVADEHETAVLYGTVEMVIAGVFAPAKTG